MIIDLDNDERSELPEYDLCIVGSGPAGATVAAELAGLDSIRVCVLESGQLTTTRRGDELRRVESEGIHIKEYSRERVLGGASTTWAGLAAPLDRIDFAEREWVEHSGWPIAREELLPYWREAAERYRFPAEKAFSESGFGALRAKGAMQPSWSSLAEKVFLAPAEPQNFGVEQRHLYERDLVDAYLDATVVELAGEPGTTRVQAARIRTRSGRTFELRARAFVVATGGLENARLLLASRDLCPLGLGNERDQVGRWLMNHPKNYRGILHLAKAVDDLPYYFGCLVEGFAGYAGLRLAEEVQRERALLNSYVRFEPLFPWSDSKGVEALVFLVKRSAFVMRRFRSKAKGEVVELRDYSETGDDSDLQNARKSLGEWLALFLAIPLDLPKVLRYLHHRLISRARPRITRVRLRNFMEMQPRAENRVTLGEELDSNGRPRPLVKHDCSELDRRSLIELHRALAEELERNGFGRLESDLAVAEPWPITQDASHHLGTTRMGADPATSVVDTDLRVHGVENVYLAGGSVFPTSGCANPTFTIVALSIRLAEHLRGVLAPEAGS